MSAVDGVELARGLVASLAGLGAEAVAVVGSHARGDAGPDSDLDLAVVGHGPHYRLEVHEGGLVSLGWAGAAEQRRRLYEPAWLAMHVPGWRETVLVHDPSGLGASIQQESRAWSWVRVERSCDAWVAEELTGLAEEVQRLRASLRTRDEPTASAQRFLLALRLPKIMAVHRRVLYGSENRVWSLVGKAVGSEWESAQRAAFGLGGEGWEAGCGAALDLFALAAQEIRPLLDKRQLAVITRVTR
jgi:hypothetical protein